MTAHLAPDVARCQPTGCRQSERCARANDWPIGEHIDLPIVDASVCLTTDRSNWCPMFIDLRGLALLEAV